MPPNYVYPMGTTIRNFIFDMGGVLVDVDQQQSIEAFKRFGLDEAEQWIDRYQQSGVFEELELGNISSEVFCSKIRHLSHDMLTNEQVIDCWNRMLGEVKPWKLDLLLSLRKRYMVYLLSNTNPIHWDFVCKNLFRYHGFDVHDFFEEEYLSYKMHLAKPSKEIFQATLNCAGIMPSETMLIDDSPANCEAARSLGMQVFCPKDSDDWRQLFDKQ